MPRPSRFLDSVPIVAPTLACVALSSALTAQQPDRSRSPSPPPKPAVQCYAIWPDTGSWPPFLPKHLVLGANPIGGIGFRAAAVSPDRVHARSGDEEDTLRAEWHAHGRLYAADSIYVDWYVPGAIYGPIGKLYAHVHGDSLSGRAVQGSDVIPLVVPWLSIHGRSESCPPGA